MTDTEKPWSQEIAELDAAYRPFPSFAEWPQAAPREDLWARYKAELESLRGEAESVSTVRLAVTTVMRAAAFDSGAIEGLYATDRGLTLTVATQAAAWQAAASDR